MAEVSDDSRVSSPRKKHRVGEARTLNHRRQQTYILFGTDSLANVWIDLGRHEEYDGIEIESTTPPMRIFIVRPVLKLPDTRFRYSTSIPNNPANFHYFPMALGM